MKKTKIIATIGPACNNEKTLKKMVQSGVDVLRINLSHANRDEFIKLVSLIKNVRRKLNKSVAIMVDTKGPEIRTGDFAGERVCLKRGQIFTFYYNDMVGTEKGCTIVQKEIFNDVKIGSVFSACNGLIRFKCVDILNKDLVCKVLTSGVIGSHKSMSFPNIKLSASYLNENDKEDIIWSANNGVDYIAGSFVSDIDDAMAIINVIKNCNSQTKVIAKIENEMGFNNLNQILSVCDGVMVARGDLGVEIPLEKVPQIQKMMIKKSKEQGKIVIIATEMLESMISSIRPTRAETSDVANAVYDGASAIMLSGETSVGKYPIETVEIMSKIALQTEKSINYKENFFHIKSNVSSIQDVMSMACVESSFALKGVKAIVVYTDTGHTAQFISRFRPSVPIIALTPSEFTFNQLALEWGVAPVLVDGVGRADDLIELTNKVVKECKFANEGDIILIGSGSRKPTKTDMMKIHIIE